jgi:hypothetical protein
MTKHEKAEATIMALTGKIVRLEHKLAIKEDQIHGLTGSVEFYKHAFYLEFARSTPLTKAVSNVQLEAITKGGQV